jgi:TPR repeat protein
MANREELGLIRGARGGHPEAQLALGRLYLYGSAGLPKSLPTALHWLDRAAQQGCGQACELIGTHIPVELALQSARPLVQWYERAYDAGVLRAGIVLAQLTLEQPGQAVDPARRAKALRALESAARAGVPDAQWLYARYHVGHALPALAGAAAASAAERKGAGERWLRRAADNGVPQARLSLLDQLWQAGDHQRFLERALPLARALLQGDPAPAALAPDDVRMLSRCAQALSAGPGLDTAGADEVWRLWEAAANENEPHAQMALGLWQARMQADGKRVAVGAGSANFKKAIRWLALAGEQGLAEAWYALSRIYIKPEFSQRNVADAQRYLERAAEMGYRDAQLECGNIAWRARRENESNDVRAVYWLQKAAAQGCAQAAAALQKIAPRGGPGGFADLAAQAPAALAASHPLLAARLRLAALLRLSRAEALLLNIRAADHGHCLVVDIRASYGRSKRRLVAISTVQERRALDEIAQQFGSTDCGPAGPEGNYRQRLYRLKTVLPEAMGEEGEAHAYELAA